MHGTKQACHRMGIRLPVPFWSLVCWPAVKPADFHSSSNSTRSSPTVSEARTNMPMLGFPTEKIFVAHNSVSPAPSSPLPSRPVTFDLRPSILFVGRLQARKRVDLSYAPVLKLEFRNRDLLSSEMGLNAIHWSHLQRKSIRLRNLSEPGMGLS